MDPQRTNLATLGLYHTYPVPMVLDDSYQVLLYHSSRDRPCELRVFAFSSLDLVVFQSPAPVTTTREIEVAGVNRFSNALLVSKTDAVLKQGLGA